MRTTFAIAAAVTAGLLGLHTASPADARAAKAKMQRAAKAEAGSPVRRSAATAPRRSAAARSVSLQDRTSINQRNGRLDGQALFDSIAERTSGAGE